MSTSVWISLMQEATGVRIRQISTQQQSPGDCTSLEMFERFCLAAQCLSCRAIRTGLGYLVNHTGRCCERIGQELEKEPEGASKVARDRERESCEPGTRSEPET